MLIKGLSQRVISAALALCITVTGLSVSTSKVLAIGEPVSVHFNYKVSQQDIDRARRERDAARSRANEVNTYINTLSGRRTTLSGELADLNQMSTEQRAQYEVIAGQLQAALEAKEAALTRFIEAQENYEAKQQLFEQRINAMFEFQNKSTLEVLLESDSIAGFFTNLEIISLIADADNQAIDQLQIAMDDAQLTADRAMAEANQMQEIADTKQAELQELERRIGVTSAALEEVSTQITLAEQELDTINAESARLDRQLRSLQSQYQAQQVANYSGGATKVVSGITFTWPTASHSITSAYGMRTHPISGVKKMHTGIDIGAGYGAAIVAAAAGRVYSVSLPVPGQNTGGTSYGNFLIIDHGNGVTTLYAHCRNIYVRSGQNVTIGQKIAEVGSTGSSTGPHLHFEVRVNGNTVNPVKYLP